MIRRTLGKLLTTGSLSAAAFGLLPATPALACGGFFCSASQPVNQAAERIVFAKNDDDTVTAVIQIMYEGPSENFSWLLPISTVPETDDIAVSSDIAFQRLQAFTNPNYSLTTRIEGTCNLSAVVGGSATSGGSFNAATATSGGPIDGGVTVEASGVVGSFEWTVISFDPALADPADAAVVWLEANEYDVSEVGAALIGPYLNDGMYLLALKLVKGSSVGSIRPIALTYQGSEPAIPIKLTAVAANDNMGVMTWLLGEARAVPNNYLSLELNEAQINWFNAGPTYDSVVTRAASEAGGQGFVTEFAGPSSSLDQVIWSSSDDANWSFLQAGGFASLGELFDYATSMYSAWDGYWDAVRTSVTLPEGVTVEDVQLCYGCYRDQLDFAPATFVTALETNVIEPVRMLQDLFDSRTYTTRLYTTMSAGDMTLDPAFTFNPDLADVSNLHTAERVIECNPEVSQFEANWRVELPQGGVVRGTAADANGQVWPIAAEEQPANLTIRQLSATGLGRVVTDNSETVNDLLAEHNSAFEPGTGTGGGTSTSTSTSTSASAGGGSSTGGKAQSASGGGGCTLGVAALHPSWLLSLGLVGLFAWRRPRRRA